MNDERDYDDGSESGGGALATTQRMPTGGAVANPFKSREVAETSGMRQSQARELAETQTAYLMAQQFPRDERRAMDGILAAFSRPGLAKRAQYAYAKGGNDITGLSIHAMQAIAQQWGNIEFGWSEVSRGIDPNSGTPFSEIRAYARDLQSRTMRPLQFIVPHMIDKQGGGRRTRDDREVYELCANMAQRRVRSCIQAIIPQDVQDAAKDQAQIALHSAADTSPEGIAKMLRVFAKFDVTKEHIEKMIQRRMEAIAPAHIIRLVQIAQSIKDGMSTAAEWFDMGEPETAAPPPSGKGSSALKTALKPAGAPKPPADPGGTKGADQTTGEIPPKPPKRPYATLVDLVLKAPDIDAATMVLDQSRDELPEDQQKELAEVWRKKWMPQ